MYGVVGHCIPLNFGHLDKKVPLGQSQMYKMFYHSVKSAFCKIIHLTAILLNSD